MEADLLKYFPNIKQDFSQSKGVYEILIIIIFCLLSKLQGMILPIIGGLWKDSEQFFPRLVGFFTLFHDRMFAAIFLSVAHDAFIYHDPWTDSAKKEKNTNVCKQ